MLSSSNQNNRSEMCYHQCGDHWCCSVLEFAPPPLSLEEIQAIEHHCGQTDFYEHQGVHHILKVRRSGYCVFFNHRTGSCDIYPVRPLDCRLFPFVCFGPGEKKVWLKWECPYSSRLSETETEAILTDLETCFGNKLLPICSYDPDGYDLEDSHPANSGKWRIIRELRIA